MRSIPRAALQSQLDELVDPAGGDGRVVVVTGEAGIGKTTLVRAVVRRRSERVLWGACEPLTTTRPLLPLHDWGLRPEGAPTTTARHDVFVETLERIIAEPTIAVIEDLHWADDGTLDLIVFLSRRVAGSAVSLVLTVRDDDASRSARVTEVLRHLSAHSATRRLAIPPLSGAEVAELADGSGLDPARICELTGGNAFFATEFVAAAGVGVPDSVRDAVTARLAPLSAGARGAAETVAVMPGRTELDIVCAAAPATTADLEEAERAGVLVSDGMTIGFRHELAREAVEQALPGALLQSRHRAVLAALLADRGSADATIAYHADLAGDHGVALSSGMSAARQSLRQGSRREACVQLARACDHIAYAEPRAAIALLRMRSEAVTGIGIGDDNAAVTLSARAVEIARELAEPDLLASELARHAYALWRVGGSARSRAALTEAVDIAARSPGREGELWSLLATAHLAMLEREIATSLEAGARAVALARELGDARAQAEALHALGTASWFARPDDAEPLLTQSLDLARTLGDDRLVALVMLNAGSGAGEVRRYDVARRWLEDTCDFSIDRDLDDRASYAHAWLARIALENGELARARELAESLTDGTGLITRIMAHTVLGRTQVRLGERGARDHLDTAWALAAPTGDLQRTWPVLAGYAEWAHATGSAYPAELEATFEEAVRLDQPWAVGELGWWLVSAGRMASGDRRLTTAAPPYAAQLRGAVIEAAELWSALGCRYEAARARAMSESSTEVRRAVTALDEIGARADADRAAARLRELDGSSIRRARRETAARPFGLTAREVEVLGLLREGLTNPEIAERTFTSVKTVGHHVSAILTKLEVAGRREAVRRSQEEWGRALWPGADRADGR